MILVEIILKSGGSASKVKVKAPMVEKGWKMVILFYLWYIYFLLVQYYK